MKNIYNCSLLLLVIMAVAEAKEDSNLSTKKRIVPPCSLSKVAADKPYPSLTFCFRNNVDACCLTAHDEMIAGNYASFMPSACSS